MRSYPLGQRDDSGFEISKQLRHKNEDWIDLWSNNPNCTVFAQWQSPLVSLRQPGKHYMQRDHHTARIWSSPLCLWRFAVSALCPFVVAQHSNFNLYLVSSTLIWLYCKTLHPALSWLVGVAMSDVFDGCLMLANTSLNQSHCESEWCGSHCETMPKISGKDEIWTLSQSQQWDDKMEISSGMS